jgi:hypothetical protein
LLKKAHWPKQLSAGLIADLIDECSHTDRRMSSTDSPVEELLLECSHSARTWLQVHRVPLPRSGRGIRWYRTQQCRLRVRPAGRSTVAAVLILMRAERHGWIESVGPDGHLYWDGIDLSRLIHCLGSFCCAIGAKTRVDARPAPKAALEAKRDG